MRIIQYTRTLQQITTCDYLYKSAKASRVSSLENGWKVLVYVFCKVLSQSVCLRYKATQPEEEATCPHADNGKKRGAECAKKLPSGICSPFFRSPHLTNCKTTTYMQSSWEMKFVHTFVPHSPPEQTKDLLIKPTQMPSPG